MRIRIGYWKSQGDHVFTVKPGQSFRVRGRMLEMTGTTSKNSTVELKIETGSPQERDALVQLFPPPLGLPPPAVTGPEWAQSEPIG